MQGPSNVAALEIPDFSHPAVYPLILFFFASCNVSITLMFARFFCETVPRRSVSFSSGLSRRSPAQIFLSLSSFRRVLGRMVQSA